MSEVPAWLESLVEVVADAMTAHRVPGPLTSSSFGEPPQRSARLVDRGGGVQWGWTSTA